jgi:hypothetical protein
MSKTARFAVGSMSGPAGSRFTINASGRTADWKPVCRIVRLAGKIHLRDEPFTLSEHLKVDVRWADYTWPSAVAAGFDGPDVVASIVIRLHVGKAVEVGIERLRIYVVGCL